MRYKFLQIIYILGILQSLFSCTLLRESSHELDGLSSSILPADYSDQLKYIGANFLNSNKTLNIKLTLASRKYLNAIYYRIVRNNELLLSQDVSPEFYIIKDSTPFYFSLPDAKFFLSSGLIKNYLKSENLLVSVLAFSIIRSLRRIYLKNLIVPVGTIGINQLMSLVRLPLEERNMINQWAFYTMKRSGYDASAYLIWLQTQNKQSLDFSVQFGNVQNISREELLFKKFVAGKDNSHRSFTGHTENSSDNFYKLVKELARTSS